MGRLAEDGAEQAGD
jgi:hypothetical protein